MNLNMSLLSIFTAHLCTLSLRLCNRLKSDTIIANNVIFIIHNFTSKTRKCHASLFLRSKVRFFHRLLWLMLMSLYFSFEWQTIWIFFRIFDSEHSSSAFFRTVRDISRRRPINWCVPFSRSCERVLWLFESLFVKFRWRNNNHYVESSILMCQYAHNFHTHAKRFLCRLQKSFVYTFFFNCSHLWPTSIIDRKKWHIISMFFLSVF